MRANPSFAQSSPVVPPTEAVAGVDQVEWSRSWWQWAGSVDSSESPGRIRPAKPVTSSNKGSVWFLAGTYGTRRTVRTCVVPRGKYLFFPLINYVVFPREEGSTNCASVTATAARMTNDVSALVLEVDGVRTHELVSHRQATKRCFDLLALHEFGRGGLFPSAANGYYIMLKPLPPGTHTLNFGGALPSMLQAVTYTLHVQ